MLFRKRTQGEPLREPLRGEFPFVLWQCFDGHPEMVDVLRVADHVLCHGERHAVFTRRSLGSFDPFQHRIQDGPRKVGFGIRQPRRIVGARGFDEGKEALPF
jgi:hypothetical protein